MKFQANKKSINSVIFLILIIVSFFAQAQLIIPPETQWLGPRGFRSDRTGFDFTDEDFAVEIFACVLNLLWWPCPERPLCDWNLAATLNCVGFAD